MTFEKEDNNLQKHPFWPYFWGGQLLKALHTQECMVEVDKKMCPSGDHPFLASRLLLLQCQSKNALNKKTKIPSFFEKEEGLRMKVLYKHFFAWTLKMYWLAFTSQPWIWPLDFVMLSKSILQQERKLLVAKKMTLHSSHG